MVCSNFLSYRTRIWDRVGNLAMAGAADREASVPIKVCPMDGHHMEQTTEEGREPKTQWTCLCGYSCPIYEQRRDEQ